jgi:hypothetical protein
MAESEKVPMTGGEERLKISPDGKAYLIGMKCKGCEETIFPKAFICPNCSSEDLEEVALSNKGKIWSYTIVHASYGVNMLGLEPPYPAAFVELSDGGYVHTAIVGCDPDDVKVGMDVEMDLVKVGESEGKEEVAYVFKPAST